MSTFKPEYIENYFPMGSSFGYFSSDKDIYPESYLEFAKNDLEDGTDKRNIINSVGNAKRAFHFQTDMLCDVFGAHIFYKGKKIDFPTKLDFLEKCGLISPNILKKLNNKRNEIEHDYHIPTLGETEDYIDIVELFLMATKNILKQFPEEIDYELMEDDDYDNSLNLPRDITTSITMSKGEVKIKAGNEIISKSIADPDFFDWLSAIMRHHVS